MQTRLSADNLPSKGSSNWDGGLAASSAFLYTLTGGDARLLSHSTCFPYTLPPFSGHTTHTGFAFATTSANPNYGERYRNGERISSSFVESTVNQLISKRFVKKQQMRWTPKGAHLLIQVRTQVLNNEWMSKFQQWYPALKVDNSLRSHPT